MRTGLRVLIAVLLATVQLAVTSQCGADDAPRPEAPTGYSSPAEAFDAFRNARGKGDWRQVFRCCTPKTQDHLVFEAYFSCRMNEGPKTSALIKAQGADEAAIDAAYNKLYQKRHGVDLAKLTAEHEAKVAAASEAYFKKQGKSKTANGGALVEVPDFSAGLPPLPPRDDALYREAVISQIANHAGFYAAATNLFATDDDKQIGKLERITVRGDTATVTANVQSSYIMSTPDGKDRKVTEAVPASFHLRRSKSGWLLETLD
jgi:hypothetical protein